MEGKNMGYDNNIVMYKSRREEIKKKRKRKKREVCSVTLSGNIHTEIRNRYLHGFLIGHGGVGAWQYC